MNRALPIVVLLATLLVACGGGSSTAAVEPEESPTVSSSPTPSARPTPDEHSACSDEVPQDMTRVELWFGDAEDESGFGTSLVVHRDIPPTPSIATATLRAWIEGPTAEEKDAGAIRVAPEGTELLGVDIKDGTAVVDMSGDFERTGLGTTYEGLVLEALGGTVTQFDTVDRALLKIDGAFKDYYMGHGFIIDEQDPLGMPGPRRYRVASTC